MIENVFAILASNQMPITKKTTTDEKFKKELEEMFTPVTPVETTASKKGIHSSDQRSSAQIAYQMAQYTCAYSVVNAHE
ncbi:MAG: hypothetical protein ATN34_04540 [Epulopiscium sp. Nele67-Bin002]|nr:MAG: hypothetical protein ATN34_04540 [Epulopiscium sp. Nele67-Bin002]OON93238.1 MAG: hypothetical protein ATN33_06045 [Epulopiscium sp. Nele67-Bin001]